MGLGPWRAPCCSILVPSFSAADTTLAITHEGTISQIQNCLYAILMPFPLPPYAVPAPPTFIDAVSRNDRKQAAPYMKGGEGCGVGGRRDQPMLSLPLPPPPLAHNVRMAHLAPRPRCPLNHDDLCMTQEGGGELQQLTHALDTKKEHRWTRETLPTSSTCGLLTSSVAEGSVNHV